MEMTTDYSGASLIRKYTGHTTSSTNMTSSSIIATQTPSPFAANGRILIALTGSLGGVGVVTNGLALVTIFAFTTMWKKINFFLLVNQIAIDFAACLLYTCQYYSIIGGDPVASIYQIRNITNEAACRWWYTKALMWSLILSSNYNIVMVTFERYFKIVHPLAYRSHMTWTKARVVIVAVWLIGFILTVPFQISSSGLANNVCYKTYFWPTATGSLAYGVFNFLVQFAVPLIVIVFIYVRLFTFIRSKRRLATTAVIPSVPGNGDPNTSLPTKSQENDNTMKSDVTTQLSHVQWNILRTALAVGMVFIGCWLWNSASFALTNAGISINYYITQTGIMLAFVSCCINPIIYTVNLIEFRTGLRKMLTKIYPQSVSSKTSTAVAAVPSNLTAN